MLQTKTLMAIAQCSSAVAIVVIHLAPLLLSKIAYRRF